MLTHDASKCPLGNNPPPPPPQDDDEDRDYNPEEPDGNFPGIAEEPMNGNADNNAQEGNANEEANLSAPKKRKTESSAKTEHDTTFPLVCCEMRQGYVTDDTQQCYQKRNIRQSEVLEVRNWFMKNASKSDYGRYTQTPPNPHGDGTVGQKPPELR